MSGESADHPAPGGGSGGDRRVCLLAPDSFKGTIPAKGVAEALAAGVAEAGFEALSLPLADGGEGSASLIRDALGGRTVEIQASDPLGRSIETSFALLSDGRAVIEVAAASGLTLVPEDERDALAASTRGTGELILAAAEAGAKEILVAAGGSATTDGGLGVVEVLREAAFDPASLPITVLCDARTRWEDCPRVFAPQKGADAGQVEELESRLDALADAMPRDPRGVDLTGAAGGLSGGLWAWFGAYLVPGAETVLDLLDFDSALAQAHCVITGEGRLDTSTGEGKLVAEVAGRARAASKPCMAVVGEDSLGLEQAGRLGLSAVREGRNAAEIAASGRQLVETTF